MTPIAQTYPQLAVQLAATELTSADLTSVRRAYDLAAELFAGAERGSGKPFIDHLVGTASGVLLGGGAVEGVAAALLHAAYDQGDFGDRRSGPTARHRHRISNAAGSIVEKLVYDYHQLGWGAHEATSTFDGTDPCVLLIRVANEIDDALDGGLVLSGKDRLQEHSRSMHELDVRLAERFGTPALAALASDVLLASAPEIPSELVVGAVRSRTRLPRSARYRLLPRLPKLAIGAARRGKAVLHRVADRRSGS